MARARSFVPRRDSVSSVSTVVSAPTRAAQCSQSACGFSTLDRPGRRVKAGSVDAQATTILLEQIRSRHDVDQTAVQKHDIGKAHRLKDAESKPHAAKPEIPACIGMHTVGRNRRWTRDRANDARSGKSKRDCSRRWPRATRRAGGNRMRPGRIAKAASATVDDRHGRTGCRSESAAGITRRQASGIEISSSTCSTRFPRETVDGMGMAVIADHGFVHFALAETLANATSDTSVWRSSCRSGHIVMRIQA